VTYVREQLPEAEVTIFYIDRRTPGRGEDLLTKVAAMKGVKLVKGKVGKIERSSAPDSLLLHVEDVEASRLDTVRADLVVLATGMVPTSRDEAPPLFGLHSDDDGFFLDNPAAGVLVAGVARRPEDVASSVRAATAAAARAMAAGTGDA
jgi:quinone-modifying oxidoreductase subunit QmoA